MKKMSLHKAAEALAIAVAAHKANDYCIACGCARYEPHATSCPVVVVLGAQGARDAEETRG
jgi:hypothetical protein